MCKIVRDFIKVNYINQTQLALEIGTTKQNLSNILIKSRSIDTEMLYNISVFLKHDFFAIYSKDLSNHITGTDLDVLLKDAAIKSRALTEKENDDYLTEKIQLMLNKSLSELSNNSIDKNSQRKSHKELQEYKELYNNEKEMLVQFREEMSSCIKNSKSVIINNKKAKRISNPYG